MSLVPLNARASSASLVASIAMLIHGTLGLFGIAAWVRTPSIVSWRVLIALLATLASLGLSAALWIAPARKYAVLAVLTLMLALLRLGLPDDWNNVSYGLIAVTAILALPVLRALFALD